MIRTRKLFTSLLLTLAMLAGSMNLAFATNISHQQLLSNVNTEMKNAAQAVFGTTTFNETNAVDFLTYIRSGVTVTEAQKAGFLNSLKNNLDNNGGKVITYGSESLGTYAAVIQILNEFDLDPTNFEGYNIKTLFESVDLTADTTTPYYYRVILEVAEGNYKNTLTDNYIDKYYTKGSGFDYWGFNSNNDGNFITALATTSNYGDYIKDAVELLEKCSEDDGYYFSNSFPGDPDGDSTAIAMMAYASLGNVEKSFDIYNYLTEHFESDTLGEFGWGDKTPDLYTTKDVLISLYYFKEVIKDGKCI